FPENIELNVGGKYFSTSVFTLTRIKDSLLGRIFSGRQSELDKDNSGKYFIDRDGFLFRYILDYLRSKALHIPEKFDEIERLKMEADFYELEDLRQRLDRLTSGEISPKISEGGKHGYISLHIRSTFAFGRSGQADVNFRKLQRICVCGRVSLLKEAFGDSLNMTRDPNQNAMHYTSRFYLKYNQLERAFMQLHSSGFEIVSSEGGKTGDVASPKSDEEKWEHFTIYYFVRKPVIQNKREI
ncbi:predicted protein, partial [Nematostella vectensis]